MKRPGSKRPPKNRPKSAGPRNRVWGPLMQTWAEYDHEMAKARHEQRRLNNTRHQFEMDPSATGLDMHCLHCGQGLAHALHFQPER